MLIRLPWGDSLGKGFIGGMVVAEAADLIAQFNASRKPALLKIKYARMAENVFAFFRGTDHLFADRWQRFQPQNPGPAVLLCGDLHLENFGAYQTDDGQFLYDINDFDESLIAPCAVDLVRCGTSILLAAEVWNISTAPAAGILLEFLDAYRQAVAAAVACGQGGVIALGQGQGAVWDLLGATASSSPAALLERHTELDHHGRRRIRRSDDKHPDLSEKKGREISDAIEAFGRASGAPRAFQVLDVTGRIAGIGSLGLRRYTVLMAGVGESGLPRLLDVKEASISSVLPCSTAPQPDFGGNEARRIIEAQRQLQAKPTAGLADLTIDGRHYRMREMVPDENHSKLDRLQHKPDQLRTAVSTVGQLTAWSHLRGCGGAGTPLARQLATWADHDALRAVLAAAVQCVDITCQDFENFSRALAQGRFGKSD